MSGLNQAMLTYFSALIEKETGIQYNEVNAHHLNSRLNDLSRFLNFTDVELMWADVQ